MRDAREALRYRVDALEQELAEKEAEIARLKGEAKEPEPSPPASEDRELDEGAPADTELGTPISDGWLRYVVRPIEWPWVIGAAGAGLLVVLLVSLQDGFQWQVAVVFGVLPVLFANQSGFDVRQRSPSVRVWSALGPFRYTHFEIARIAVPEARTISETNDNGTRARKTYLYWGSRFIRATLKKSDLSRIVAEVAKLGPQK